MREKPPAITTPWKPIDKLAIGLALDVYAGAQRIIDLETKCKKLQEELNDLKTKGKRIFQTP